MSMKSVLVVVGLGVVLILALLLMSAGLEYVAPTSEQNKVLSKVGFTCVEGKMKAIAFVVDGKKPEVAYICDLKEGITKIN